MKTTWVKLEINDNYSINELGEIRNTTTSHIKKPTLNKNNKYFMVDLYKNNNRVKTPVHRLVAKAFIPNPENKPTVDHKDGDRQNNSVDNLRWATYSEQNSRFNESGVRSEKVTVTMYKEKRKKRGGGHEAWLDVEEIKFFDSISDVAEHFDVTVGNISMMLEKGSIGQRGKMRCYKFEYTQGERARHS